MLRDGLYKIAYLTSPQPLVVHDEALAVVRRGRIFASDRHGGVYRGHDYPGEQGSSRVIVEAHVPPDGELATGFSAGLFGATVSIVGDIDPVADDQRATIQIAGAPLEIGVTYLGPLNKQLKRRMPRA